MSPVFRPVLCLRFLAVSLLAQGANALAQDPAPATPVAKTALPLRLDLSRRDLKNFLTDETARAPYRLADGTTPDLRDLFTLGSVNAPYAVFWDPLSCRLLGILDIEAPSEPEPDKTTERTDEAPSSPSPYLFKATGPMPLTGTAGVSGAPHYFGFRLVEGRPEFLYTCGTLSVEERLWLEEGGQVLKQRFSAKDAVRGIQIAVPDAWKGRVEATAGTWKGPVLSVPKDSVSEVILTYPLAPATAGTEPAKPDSN